MARNFVCETYIIAETLFEIYTKKPVSSKDHHEDFHHHESEALTLHMQALVSGFSILLTA